VCVEPKATLETVLNSTLYAAFIEVKKLLCSIFIIIFYFFENFCNATIIARSIVHHFLNPQL
jgi:hypothetical protein